MELLVKYGASIQAITEVLHTHWQNETYILFYFNFFYIYIFFKRFFYFKVKYHLTAVKTTTKKSCHKFDNELKLDIWCVIE